MVYSRKPKPFFTIIVHDTSSSPGLTGAVAGYELSEWRNEAMAEHLLEWIPEFALRYSDLTEGNPATWRERLRHAARIVYQTKKTEKRGEIGELILHAIVREVFNSEPAISKMYFKSAVNDTIKGFDAVHIVDANNELELWLGESKFYTDYSSAASEVIAEIYEHLGKDYLRNEFALITGKLDQAWKHYEKIKSLLDKNTSLDQVFNSLHVPVLLTYESPTVLNHNEVSSAFKEEMDSEIKKKYLNFSGRKLPNDIVIHLILMPLESKAKLIQEFDRKLKGQQA